MRETAINYEGTNADTQKNRLRRYFLERPMVWIPLPEILKLGIAQYGARTLELRRAGMIIENKIMETINGQKHTAFRYVPSEGKQLNFVDK
jgi:hypothetical protein